MSAIAPVWRLTFLKLTPLPPSPRWCLARLFSRACPKQLFIRSLLAPARSSLLFFHYFSFDLVKSKTLWPRFTKASVRRVFSRQFFFFLSQKFFSPAEKTSIFFFSC